MTEVLIFSSVVALLGIVVWIVLPDRPADARWLTSEEREALAAAIAADRAEAGPRAHLGVMQALRQPVVLLLAMANCLVVIGHYGVDFNAGKPKSQWIRLANLVEWLCRIPGQFRLRLSSIEATEVSRELVAVMSQHGDKVCPHLHVCLQSGSDSVLRRMRRRWGARRFVDRCRLVRERLDYPALTTDVIVGFPGETDDDFAATWRVCEEAGFSKIHIFPFSLRRTTPAAEMADQVDPQLKAERCRSLAELEASLRRRYFSGLVGRELEVLVESPAATPGSVMGTACRYATVEMPGDESQVRHFVRATARAVSDDRILARPVAI